jgi:subtilisin family serine protease
MSGVLEALTTATVPEAIGPGAHARFALVLRPDQDPAIVTAEIRSALASLGARVAPLSALDHGVLVVDLPWRGFGTYPAAFAAGYTLREAFDLAEAEPDLPTDFFPEPTPSDPRVPTPEALTGFPPGCWAPAEPALDADPGWALRALRVPEAWAFSEALARPTRGDPVVVAQIDTGLTAHLELDRAARAPGFDVLGGDSDPTDPMLPGNPGHGTGTASVLVSPGTFVVTGSAPRARHMAVRAIESVIRITQVSVARGLDWAVGNGAAVVSMSLGGIPSFSLHRALRRAVDADVIVLAAAGNCVRTVVWPARYDECVAVGGTDARDRMWPGSCWGAAVDVAAPAQNVIHARAGASGRDVGQGQGTSYAVALVAGVAALWLGHHGRPRLIAEARARGETLQEMFLRLLRATARRPVGWDTAALGAGVADARALLAAGFDLGRDRESLQQHVDARIAAAVSVESLAAESLGPEAVARQALDWHRFGPEVAALLLSGRLAAPIRTAPAAARLSRTGAAALTASGPLAEAVGDGPLHGLVAGGRP